MRFTFALCAALTATVTLGVTSTPTAEADRFGADDRRPSAAPKLGLAFDRAVYPPGSAVTLKVTENVRGPRAVRITDSTGARWHKVAETRRTVTFRTDKAKRHATVSVTVRRARDGATARSVASYRVARPPSSSPTAEWPGHQPGEVILGMSCGTVCGEKERQLGQDYGVHRQYKSWGEWAGVAQDIRDDHAAGRLPWISVKSPRGADGWQAVADGDYDAGIRELAAVLKAHDDQPVILTFHHEPSNDAPDSEGRRWAAAYTHWHDTLEAEGALANTADVPIIGDWLFNPRNKAQEPENWVMDGVLRRAPFLGIDMYENAGGATFAERIPFITDWMAARGFPHLQVGIGETGSTDHYGRSTAVRWMNESLAWALAHPEQVGVVSYFNSVANSRAGVYWPLDESAAKLDTFRAWLDASAATTS